MTKRRGGDAVAIKDLFSKYKNKLIAPQKSVEMEMIRVVGECLGINLKESQVTYTVSSRTLSLQVSGMIKQEVKIRSGEILFELKKRLGERNAPLHIL